MDRGEIESKGSSNLGGSEEMSRTSKTVEHLRRLLTQLDFIFDDLLSLVKGMDLEEYHEQFQSQEENLQAYIHKILVLLEE